MRANDVDALHLLGASLAAQKRSVAALEAYAAALRLAPNHPELLNNFGATLADAGRHAEASEAFAAALGHSPRYVDALVNLGSSRVALRQMDRAAEALREALAIDPTAASAHCVLGVCLAAQGKLDEAIDAYREAIHLRGDYSNAWNNLGVAHWEMDQPEAALAAYERALAADPHNAECRNNLGNCYLRDGRVDEAIAAFEHSLRMRPDFVDAWCNLGIALMEQGDPPRAADAYGQALKLAPDAAEAHWNLACHHLLLGDFSRGWVEYEWRWFTRARATNRRDYPRPVWTGQPLEGKTLLLYTEQGYGDCIQFIRYAPLLARRGARVILLCSDELRPLFSGVDGIAQLIGSNDDLEEFDFYCPLMSLPLLFKTQLASIPADVPYIAVDHPTHEHWKRRVEEAVARSVDAATARLKVGLVWAGGALYRNDRKRSASLGDLAPLAAVADVEFYSLQKGAAAEQVKSPPPGMTLIDLSADLHDFSDTAALILQLDLIISVDTAVAHLAGALGRPVWLMLPTNADWRWLLHRDDSPWYPTMRLFRQRTRGQWREVVERLSHVLRGLRMPAPATLTSDSDAPAADVPRQLSTRDAIALGYQHHLAGRFAEAGAVYRQILAQQPRNSDVLHLMGQAALDAGRADLAVQWMGRAVAANPAIAEFHHALGRALAANEQRTVAIEAYRQALSLDADLPDAQFNLGNALRKLGRYEEAVTAYKAALRVGPETFDLWINLGAAQAELGEHRLALDAFRSALRLRPEHPQTRVNIAMAHVAEREHGAAEKVLHEVLADDGENAEAQWLLGTLRLTLGDFAGGWPRLEWRWRRKGATPLRAIDAPRWDGSPLAGRTLLVHAEQGLGDTIQFIRFAHQAGAGGRVIVECPPALIRLLNGADGVSDAMAPEMARGFDVHCPLMSLPLALGTAVQTLPAATPYLHVEKSLADMWTARVEHALGAAGVATERTRVGIVWAGRPTFQEDRKRSLTLGQLAPLFDAAKAPLFSLQHGTAAAAADQRQAFSMIDLTPEVRDMADTAALIMKLDLVISVDTAVGHLAGALGKPVWMLIPYDADWRWMLDRSHTPWYPTMRLFRQARRGDWAEVIARAADALAAWSRG